MAKKPLGDVEPPVALDVSALKRRADTAAPPSADALAETLRATSAGFVTTRQVVQPRRLVKDAFAIPEDEYALIGAAQMRAGLLSRPNFKKVEVIRAALKALSALSDPEFLALIDGLPDLKPGPRR